jgi:nickel transport system substrate-binding protein
VCKAGYSPRKYINSTNGTDAFNESQAREILIISPPTQTGYFRIGRDIGNMNPHVYSPNEFVTIDFVFEGLVAWDPTSSGRDGINGTEDDGVVGALAKSWTSNVDPYDTNGIPSNEPFKITFKLRTDVIFHDGEKWDAEAAKINFDHILGGLNKSNADFHNWYGLPDAISSWSVGTDAHTFIVAFSHYYEPALRELTFIRPFRMVSLPKCCPQFSMTML